MSSSEEDSASSDDSESGAQEHNSQQEESFDMYEDDPMHSPSNDYLEKLRARFRKVCDEKKDWQKRQECWRIFENTLCDIRKWREADGWYGPPSDSYHFEGDELFSGFAFHDEHPTTLMPWDLPTRKEIEERFSTLKHLKFVHKTGIFAQTINKFVQKHCPNKHLEKEKEPVVIDLPPSTKENPIRTRIQQGVSSDDRWWPLYLVGHDTVLQCKSESPRFPTPMFFPYDEMIMAHQIICLDITFVGSVFSFHRFCCYVRLYNCTFTQLLHLVPNAMLIDCRGTELVIPPSCEDCRMLNCKFDSVRVIGGRLLAKGCEFGKLDIVKFPRPSLYFLDDCKVGERLSTASSETAYDPWPDYANNIREAFRNIQKLAFKPLRFKP